MRKLMYGLAAAALSTGGSAAAASTSVNYSFGPVGAGQGSMTLSYDATTSTYTLTSLNFMIVGSASYDTVNAAFDPYIGGYALYGKAGGFSLASPSLASDFLLVFDPHLGAQTVDISWTSKDVFAEPFNSIVTITRADGGVPEPSTWAMMLLGFAAIGLAMRRSRKRGAALA